MRRLRSDMHLSSPCRCAQHCEMCSKFLGRFTSSGTQFTVLQSRQGRMDVPHDPRLADAGAEQFLNLRRIHLLRDPLPSKHVQDSQILLCILATHPGSENDRLEKRSLKEPAQVYVESGITVFKALPIGL